MKRWLLQPIVLILVAFVAGIALGRPGGGGSFSGGGGDDGGIEFFFDIALLVFQICVDYPEVGVPLIVVVLVIGAAVFASESTGMARVTSAGIALGGTGCGFAFVPNFALVLFIIFALIAIALAVGHFSGKKKRPDWSVAPVSGDRRQAANERTLFKKITQQDPDFSPVVFGDFIYALYSEVHRARGAQQLGRLTPYLSEAVRKTLTNPALASVSEIIVASAQVSNGNVSDQLQQLEIAYESNLTERVGKESKSYYVRETWTLERLPGAKSRPPDKVASFPCPNCGAPLDPEQSSVCQACGETIDTGRFDWRIKYIQTHKEERAPILTADVAEVGTNAPTVIDPMLTAFTMALTQRDPAFSVGNVERRLRLIFSTFQTAWSERSLEKMRPFLSDRLFNAQQQWVAAYKKAGLRNITEKTTVARVEAAKLTSDKYYDAITFRVFASGLDYTVDEKMKTVAGSLGTKRDYTEYWTLIRSAKRVGAASDALTCPNCAAELHINMAGICEACDAKVTSGEFDWVLSRIEQDEVYRG